MVRVQIVDPVTEVAETVGTRDANGHDRSLVDEPGVRVVGLAGGPVGPARRHSSSLVRGLGHLPQLLRVSAAAAPELAVLLDVLLALAGKEAVELEVLFEHGDVVHLANLVALGVNMDGLGVVRRVAEGVDDAALLGRADEEAASVDLREVRVIVGVVVVAGGHNGRGVPDRQAVGLEVGHSREEVGGRGLALGEEDHVECRRARVAERVGRVEDLHHGRVGEVAPGEDAVGVERVGAVAVLEDHGVVRRVGVRETLEVGRPRDAHHLLEAVIVGGEALTVHRRLLAADELEEFVAAIDLDLVGLDGGLGREVRLEERA
mmetsp:Transcript_5992/g.13993  ORF Transcript_5992/g.13993 Transcript_5992/m.13993 type:complete len:319 (-) Transcript_5992:52-1008(-)